MPRDPSPRTHSFDLKTYLEIRVTVEAGDGPVAVRAKCHGAITVFVGDRVTACDVIEVIVVSEMQKRVLYAMFAISYRRDDYNGENIIRECHGNNNNNINNDSNRYITRTTTTSTVGE